MSKLISVNLIFYNKDEEPGYDRRWRDMLPVQCLHQSVKCQGLVPISHCLQKSCNCIHWLFFYCTGLIEVVVSTLSEAALAHLDGEGHAGRKVSHLVLQALLELLHNILKQTSVVVRSALQVWALKHSWWERETNQAAFEQGIEQIGKSTFNLQRHL